MLKPNYNSKVTNKNYKIGHGHGNLYFNSQKNTGINEILVNGFIIRFIPHYDINKYSFPPNIDELIQIRESDREFKDVNQKRFYSFYNSDVVFFEYNQKSGENIFFCADEDELQNDTNLSLIHCIDTMKFKLLTTEMQRKMPYIQSERNLSHHIKHDDIADLKFVQFLDAKFQELKDLLPPKFRESLEL